MIKKQYSFTLTLILILNLKQFQFYTFHDQKARFLERAKELLDKNPLIDGHNDLPHMIRANFQNRIDKFDLNDLTNMILNGTNNITHTDIKRIRDGKLSGQFWAIYANCQTNAKDSVRRHLEQIDLMFRLINKYSNDFKFVKNSNEIKEAFKNKKIISLFGMESGHGIDSSLAVLRMFYDLGVRYMTLTHNCNVPWATNNLIDRLSNSTLYGGLTEFGRKVIREMNRLGMIVDLSHVSYQTMLDSLDESKSPVMFSHSSVYSLCNHTRNVRDDVLLKLKKNNGIIMINLYSGFIKYQGIGANLKAVVEHFNYVKNLIGVEHIGVGADSDGVDSLVDGFDDVSKYPNLFAALLEDGWSEDDLIKVAGGNIIRVLSDVENYSKKISNMEPLDDIIDKNDLGSTYDECRTSF